MAFLCTVSPPFTGACAPRTLHPVPSEMSCTMAQFRNKDRIKIPAETVRSSASSTKEIASETSLHRMTRAAVRNRTVRNREGVQQNEPPARQLPSIY